MKQWNNITKLVFNFFNNPNMNLHPLERRFLINKSSKFDNVLNSYSWNFESEFSFSFSIIGTTIGNHPFIAVELLNDYLLIPIQGDKDYFLTDDILKIYAVRLYKTNPVNKQWKQFYLLYKDSYAIFDHLFIVDKKSFKECIDLKNDVYSQSKEFPNTILKLIYLKLKNVLSSNKFIMSKIDRIQSSNNYSFNKSTLIYADPNLILLKAKYLKNILLKKKALIQQNSNRPDIIEYSNIKLTEIISKSEMTDEVKKIRDEFLLKKFKNYQNQNIIDFAKLIKSIFKISINLQSYTRKEVMYHLNLLKLLMFQEDFDIMDFPREIGSDYLLTEVQVLSLLEQEEYQNIEILNPLYKKYDKHLTQIKKDK